MASNSKNINMPIVFTVAACAVIAVCASTVFAMAWYSHEKKTLLEDRVADAPFHDESYTRAYDDQMADIEEEGSIEDKFSGEWRTIRLMPIDEAMDAIVAQNDAVNGHDADHDHDHDDHEGHEH